MKLVARVNKELCMKPKVGRSRLAKIVQPWPLRSFSEGAREYSDEQRHHVRRSVRPIPKTAAHRNDPSRQCSTVVGRDSAFALVRGQRRRRRGRSAFVLERIFAEAECEAHVGSWLVGFLGQLLVSQTLGDDVAGLIAATEPRLFVH